MGDAFYETVVAPRIRESEIDVWFEAIRTGSADGRQRYGADDAELRRTCFFLLAYPRCCSLELH